MNDETKIDVATAEPVTSYDDLDLAGEAAPRRRRWPVIAVIGLALAIGAWLLLRPGSDAAPADKADQSPTVTVVSPGRGTVQGVISATGTLAARREIPVGSVGEGGQVVSVLVDAGDWVRQGEVLAVVDRSVQNQQAASQSAQISVAQADANLAQANLDRALKLVARGFISKADVDRLTATRDAAVARVRVARAQLGELQARANRLSIVAPAAGLVLERNTEPGQVVGAASGVLFRIAKGGEMELMAQVSESDLTALSVGETANVTPVGTDRSFTGQIWQLSPTINPQTRQGMARIALAYDAALRPGGFASANIDSGTVVAPLLPESAVLSDDKGTFVYIVGGNNKVIRQPVKTGLVTRDGIAITSGLSGNERVVLRAGGFLAPGDKVIPKAAASQPAAG
ncbi:efflux RND transporter periplasmic adaptor subunit [Novosphingobium tardum]|uniref:Efflux RND transporter periplasmic adaptor subunit n=1 Tax=Novosphingobium tardum TaxID=1538021 RepID=A0ABV8RKW7_9SPHN